MATPSLISKSLIAIVSKDEFKKTEFITKLLKSTHTIDVTIAIIKDDREKREVPENILNNISRVNKFVCEKDGNVSSYYEKIIPSHYIFTNLSENDTSIIIKEIFDLRTKKSLILFDNRINELWHLPKEIFYTRHYNNISIILSVNDIRYLSPDARLNVEHIYYL